MVYVGVPQWYHNFAAANNQNFVDSFQVLQMNNLK